MSRCRSICQRAGASPTPEHVAKHTAVGNPKAGRLSFLWVSSMHAAKTIRQVEHEAYGRLLSYFRSSMYITVDEYQDKWKSIKRESRASARASRQRNIEKPGGLKSGQRGVAAGADARRARPPGSISTGCEEPPMRCATRCGIIHRSPCFHVDLVVCCSCSRSPRR